MQLGQGKIRGDLRIAQPFTLGGTVTGSMVVADGGRLDLFGTVRGNLTLEPGAHVVLKGIVRGDVINNGGHLEVSGVVGGDLRHEAGDSVVHPTATIEGQTTGAVMRLPEPP